MGAEGADERGFRVLYLAPLDLSLCLGHATHVRRLSEALEARGHVVRILSIAGRQPATWKGTRGGERSVRRRGPRGLRHLATEGALARLMAREIGAFTPDLLLVRQELFTLAPLIVGTRLPMLVETNSSLPAVAQASGVGARRVRRRRRGLVFAN